MPKQVKRKSEILETARKVINERGIQGATLRAIAEEAGVSTGAIYHYFKSKEEIMYAVMDESLSVSTQIAADAISTHKDKALVLNEIIENIYERFNKVEDNRIQFYLAKEAMMGDPELAEKFKFKYSEWIGHSKELIQFLYEKPEHPLDDAVASLLIGAVDGMVMQLLLGANVVSADEMGKVYAILLKEGLPNFIDQIRKATEEQ